MFNLVIIIIAVALAIAFIVLSMYHGGDIITKGTEEADVARKVNEVSQLRGAIIAYQTRVGQSPAALSDLLGNELSSLPEGWGVSVPSLTAYEATRVTGTSESTRLRSCQEINTRLGHKDLSEPPACDSIGPNFSGCCVIPD